MTDHITIPRALLEQALAALTHEGHFPWANKQYFVEAIRAELAKPVDPPYTYASTQATTCACCGKYKHTPLRIDAMDGYVCLTCIDQKLGSLLGEFGYPEPTPAWHDAPTRPGLWFNSINHYADIVSQHWIDRGVVANSHARWYGPIPQDKEGGAA